MQNFKITPGKCEGTIAIPPSKSHTLRALIFGMMAKGKSIIRNYLHSPDTTAMIAALRQFGVKIEIFPERLEVEGLNGVLGPAENVIQAGNSGQVLRFIGALAALSPHYTVITGDQSIRHQRPVKPLLSALNQLGVLADSARGDGFAPIIIKGPISPGKASLCGMDSQPVSALLIALSFLKGVSHLTVVDPGERPWIDLTLDWMRRLGIRVEHQNHQHYTIFGHAAYAGFDVTIPADWSSAAYPLAAAIATNSRLTLCGVDMDDVQGDKKLVEILLQMGAKIDQDNQKNTLTIQPGSVLQGQTIDVNDCIDAITILAVIGCYAKGTTRIVGGKIARSKETDRIKAICSELRKMGACIEETEDGLVVTSSPLHGAELTTYSDHRMALSLAVAGMGAHGSSQIMGIECIAKTYPTFASDFQALGSKIEVFS
jgi:3-phosphoshikimate 1-carboxyvinyltransferase